MRPGCLYHGVESFNCIGDLLVGNSGAENRRDIAAMVDEVNLIHRTIVKTAPSVARGEKSHDINAVLRDVSASDKMSENAEEKM